MDEKKSICGKQPAMLNKENIIREKRELVNDLLQHLQEMEDQWEVTGFKKICMICLNYEDEDFVEHEFVACVLCSGDYHINCLKVTVSKKMRNKWSCMKCRNKLYNRQCCIICGGEGDKNTLRCAKCPQAFDWNCVKDHLIYPVIDDEPWFCNHCCISYLVHEEYHEFRLTPKHEKSKAKKTSGNTILREFCEGLANMDTESSDGKSYTILIKTGQTCEICLIQENMDQLFVTCKECNKSYHKLCVKPEITGRVKAKWYCALCKNKDNNRRHCIVCNRPGLKNFLVCAKCPRKYHTRCLEKPSFCKASCNHPWLCDACFIKYKIIPETFSGTPTSDDIIPEKVCELCLKSENEGNVDKFISCSECHNDFHASCLIPAMTKVPKRKWCCHLCKGKQNDKRNCVTCGGEETENLLVCAKCPRTYHGCCLKRQAFCPVTDDKWMCDSCFIKYTIVPAIALQFVSLSKGK